MKTKLEKYELLQDKKKDIDVKKEEIIKDS